jgi:hypothetical protein
MGYGRARTGFPFLAIDDRRLPGLAVALLAAGLACGTPPREGDLGNPRNPVRAHSFLGELEYLSRLRCPDGTQPHFQRLSGTAGRGLRAPCGHFVNGYRVRCIYLNLERRVFIDPHHPHYAEPVAVGGFTAAGPPDRRRLFWFEP